MLLAEAAGPIIEQGKIWEELAAIVGSQALRPILLSETPSDYTKIQNNVIAELDAPIAPEVTSNHEAAIYTIGGVAVEAAGIERADQLPGEKETKLRYQFLGNEISVRKDFPILEEQLKSRRSSLDILRSAAEGDQTSCDALLLDAKTHVGEVFGGVGEILEVELDVDDGGRIMWGGQSTEDRQYHALTSQTGFSEAIIGVVHAEGLASFRLEDRNRDGRLEGKRVFTLSAMPIASHKELTERGYFLNSVAVSLQEAKFVGSKCQLRSAFVAGVDQRQVKPLPEETELEEKHRQEKALELRFDINVLRKMYARIGIKEAMTMTVADLLSAGLVSDKYDLLDFVMLYDQLASEEMEEGAKTFFGSVELWESYGAPGDLKREHYEQHMKGQGERRTQQESLSQAIVREQVRRHHEATTPAEAAELKRRVVLDMTIERAIGDVTIDASRFGRKSERYIHEARWRYANGDIAGGDIASDQAKSTAVDPSCPGGKGKEAKGDDKGSDKGSEASCKEVKDGDIVKCPYCGHTVRAKVPKKGGRIFCPRGECSSNS